MRTCLDTRVDRASEHETMRACMCVRRRNARRRDEERQETLKRDGRTECACTVPASERERGTADNQDEKARSRELETVTRGHFTIRSYANSETRNSAIPTLSLRPRARRDIFADYLYFRAHMSSSRRRGTSFNPSKAILRMLFRQI